uniref:Uncharacterized protein n=1 Tax=Zea mays TaxID=4577 RepID=C4IYP3_MAIZE|nr:unknown [Zea mays]
MLPVQASKTHLPICCETPPQARVPEAQWMWQPRKIIHFGEN